jgi:hypothetical protein
MSLWMAPLRGGRGYSHMQRTTIEALLEAQELTMEEVKFAPSPW